MNKGLILFSTALISIVGIIIVTTIWSAIQRRRTVRQLRREEWSREHKKMRPEAIALLPEPVRKYLSHVIREGEQQIRFVTVRQRGEWRALSQPKWGKLNAIAYHSGTIPGLVWHARIAQSPWSWTTAQLLYGNGHGSGYVKFWGFLTLFDPSGPEVSMALLSRILMETVWFPTALIPGGMLRWEPINATSAKAYLSDNGRMISAIFHFNEKNEIERVITRDKYRDAETSYEREQCTMYCSDYRDFGGILIPTNVRLEWNMEEGDFEYARITVPSARIE